jgi:hypothetical protein
MSNKLMEKELAQARSQHIESRASWLMPTA